MKESDLNKKKNDFSNIFLFMDGIGYSTYEIFIDTVTKMRDMMLIPDKGLPMSDPV